MATIKAIEAKAVHQIQSGQVIVDLCSVVKELVENSLDAGATTLEVRFKNYGLESIEVQDNGSGIDPANYESVALKHYTSKLSSYDDLSTLETFGFRGEALSSLCALSNFYMTTAQANDAPKGTKLEFNVVGSLKSTSTVACGRGTTATVEDLFNTLPVRRKELTKNIKREYGKVLGLLQSYACIGVNVKFTLKNTMPKGKSMVVFSTKGNATTRENIANIFSAKTLPALVALDLQLDFQPSSTQRVFDAESAQVVVKGHISKPVFGEGRQTPDRQMFFVNGRPCGLPQIAKAINEVYKSFNVSQSPFIFADLRMDTNAYDVNVSPDKRTILLHNAAALIESLKESLTDLFDNHEQTVPQSQLQAPKLPAFRQLSVQRPSPAASTPDKAESGPTKGSKVTDDSASLDDTDADVEGKALTRNAFADHFRNEASTREGVDDDRIAKKKARLEREQTKRAEKAAKAVNAQLSRNNGIDEYDDVRELQQADPGENEEDGDDTAGDPTAIHVRDFNARIAEQQAQAPQRKSGSELESPIPTTSPVKRSEPPGPIQNAFDRMRPLRLPTQLATITVDDETTTTIIGTQMPAIVQQAARTTSSKKPAKRPRLETSNNDTLTQFSQRLQRFGAGGGTHKMLQSDSETGPSEESVDSESPIDEASHEESRSEVEDDDSTSPDDTKDVEMEVLKQSDSEYVDEEEEKAEEDARVAELIRAAEETISKVNNQRATKALKGMLSRDSTRSLMTTVDTTVESIQRDLRNLQNDVVFNKDAATQEVEGDRAEDEEARLQLTVSKQDFAKMEIAGQFNLGFILAVRRADKSTNDHKRDELFIIDQHASDEKFNFERLQAETTVGNQRMVRPVVLDLTAVEEEIVLENGKALEKNGFLVEVDTSGNQPVGRRCTLHTLPLSKEAVFDTRDLDELIHLLSESPMLGTNSAIPRPSRVRKMFAMRACRSSIMIGKTLSQKQMKSVVSNMGTIDKPWNCPHGRPTMRHLTSLDAFKTWSEGDGFADSETAFSRGSDGQKWQAFLDEV